MTEPLNRRFFLECMGWGGTGLLWTVSGGLASSVPLDQALAATAPRGAGKVKPFTFLQISPPSRADVLSYQELRRDIEHAAGHVNGKYSDIDWVPIRFVVKTVSRMALAGIYRSSRVGLVTPWRDGMNLVAKEYVASQDPDDPGVLVLSRFAGAAAITADIGGWNQQTVTRMGRAHQIYVPARTLTGEQVTDERALAQAKIAGRLGLAPTELLEATTALYARTSPRKDSALLGANGLTLRTEPLVSDLATTMAPASDPISRAR